MADPVTLGALVVEAGLGWPDRLYRTIGHPVGAFAALIGVFERRWNQPTFSAPTRKAAGIAAMLVLVSATAAFTLLLGWGIHRLAGPWSWILAALLAAPGLAQRALHDHVAAVAAPLEQGQLDEARASVSRIVGRDTSGLDESAVARAAVESLSESFCDGVVAPVFWLLVLGLPGLWIYKAVNTADSLIGHMEPRWRSFGWAAARVDDVANLVPARVSALLICLAGAGGIRTVWEDAGKHLSPNAGWPEAAMAGALGLRLGGPIAYDGVTHDKPWFGTGSDDAGAAEIRRSLRLYRRACLLLWLLAGGAAWAL